MTDNIRLLQVAMITLLCDRIRVIRVGTVAFVNTVVFGVLGTIGGLFNRSKKRIPDFFIRLWARVFIFFSGSKMIVEGLSNYDWSKPHVIMANHSSYFDPPFLMAALRKRTKFIMKEELGKIPVFAWALRAGGHIFLNRKNPRKAKKSLEMAGAWLKKGVSVVIFPEGTMNTGKLLPFKQGGFKLATENAVPILPVTIINAREAWGAGKWYQITKQKVRIVVGKPIEATDAVAVDRVKDFFEKNLSGSLEAVV